MTQNKVKNETIGYITDENGKHLGTCFLFCEKHIFTARHVIKNYIFTANLLKCVFPEINFETSCEIIFEKEEYDVAILKYDQEIEIDDIFLNFAVTEAEKGDKWETYGYPVLNKKQDEYVYGNIRRITNNNPCTIYELKIDEVKEDSDWSGISGAPLIINNEIAGLVVKEVETNIKSRLKAISFFGIFELLEGEEIPIINKIKSNYDSVLSDRMKFFEESIEEIFYKYTFNKGIINSECFLLKSTNGSLEKLVEMLCGSIKDYGSSIVLYKKSKEGNYRERFEADVEIQERKKKILKLISTNEQLIYILLWTLAEGIRHCPRIGSRILDSSSGAATDIYIDERGEMNIYFSCGQIDDDYLVCLDAGLSEINKYVDNEKLSMEDEIIDWDELVVSSLNYPTRKKLLKFRETGINVGVFMICSFEHYEIYNKEDMYDEVHDCDCKKRMYEKFIKEKESEIERVLKKYPWISKIDIVHFVLPFNDLAQFRAIIDQKM